MRLAFALLVIIALLMPFVMAGCGSSTGDGGGLGGLAGGGDEPDPGLPGGGGVPDPGTGGTNDPGTPDPPAPPGGGGGTTDPGGPPPPPDF